MNPPPRRLRATRSRRLRRLRVSTGRERQGPPEECNFWQMNPLLAVLVMLAILQGAPTNLLTNGDARHGSAGWKARANIQGTATTEIIGGVPCFTVRSPGSFEQEVALPPSAAGLYAALVGRGYSERVNDGGSITGL